MHALLLSEEVALHVLFAPVEHHVRTPRVDVEIAVLAADGTVAVGDLEPVERWHVDFVFDGSAVAVGFVPHLGWLLGF